MIKVQCQHPKEQRWQYPDAWRCCLCNSDFWGDKRGTPPTDIYGRTDAWIYVRDANPYDLGDPVIRELRGKR